MGDVHCVALTVKSTEMTKTQSPTRPVSVCNQHSCHCSVTPDTARQFVIEINRKQTTKKRTRRYTPWLMY